MNKQKIDAIREWLYATQEKEIEECDTAFSKSFGFIIMEDGRKAQIKVTLELDEDDWD